MTEPADQNQLKSERTLLEAKIHDKLAFVGCGNCRINCCKGNSFFHAEVLLNELQDSSKLFPVVFIKYGERIRMSFIFSIKKGVPCPYQDFNSRECTVYDRARPRACRIYPFSLGPQTMRGSEQSYTISFDSRCEGLQESAEGIQIITDNGELSEEILANFLNPGLLANFEENIQATHKFLKLVDDLDLLSLEKIVVGNKFTTGKGFHDVELDVLKISEKKLAALDKDSVMLLQSTGYIKAINDHLNSLSHFSRFYQAAIAFEKSRQSTNMLNFTFGR
jgi:Fe-S-cluster containining protein